LGYDGGFAQPLRGELCHKDRWNRATTRIDCPGARGCVHPVRARPQRSEIHDCAEISEHVVELVERVEVIFGGMCSACGAARAGKSTEGRTGL
jgi:hypothetical protein